MNRRGFLTSILALGVAPAIVRASSLMPVWTPTQKIVLPTLDEIIATTISSHRAEMVANISSRNALLIKLMEQRIQYTEKYIEEMISVNLYSGEDGREFT